MNIIQAIEAQESRASARGNLSDDRQSALDRYMGRPYGDEVEGRSQVVMRDVADTIEWIKPSLLKIFCAGDEFVRFNAVGKEDEQAAQQETDFCNHIVMQKNNGFLIFHDWFHDALLQKNGYVVVRAVEKRDMQREVYKHQSDDEFAALVGGDEVELVEYGSTQEPAIGPDGMPQMVTYHDCVVRKVKEYTCVEITNVAPERVLIDESWSGLSLDGCPFVEVIDYKTISQLKEEGYDVEEDINDTAKYNEDEYAADQRDLLADQRQDDKEDQIGPMRRVKVRYVWIRHDEDGDGIAELRRVVVVGTTELENEEDDITPVAALTPIRMPHEHVGLSIDDIVQDLQRIRTVLTRGALDSTYMSLHPQTYIDINRVNLDDMLVTRVGGIRRVNGNPGDAVMEAVRPNTAGDTLQLIEYVDTVRENRTGVTKYNQGLDSESLNKTAHGMSQIMSASQQRIELIARLFAESGVKALMLIVHAMSIKHGRQPEMLKLRGEWVPIDPRGWKTRKDLTVSVGIGTGNKDQMLQHLFMILQQQMQVMPLGLVTPENLYNTLKRIVQNAGFKQAEEFLTDVSKKPPQPPPPNPEMMKLQADQQKTQAQIQADGQKTVSQQEAAAQQQAQQLAHDADQKERDRQLELAKVQLIEANKIELARLNHDSAMQSKATDQHFQAGQAQQQEAKEADGKAQETAKRDNVVAELKTLVQGMADAMNRPMTIKRGPDGRAAEIH